MAGQFDFNIIAERLRQEDARLSRAEPVVEAPVPEAVAVSLNADPITSKPQSATLLLLARRVARRVPGARRLRDWMVRRRQS